MTTLNNDQTNFDVFVTEQDIISAEFQYERELFPDNNFDDYQYLTELGY